MTFQQRLRESIITNCDPKLNPRELLVDTFKYFIAEMLKENVQKNKNRIAAGFIQALCAHCVNTFRSADLGDYQLSEKRYADLFNECIQEILNDASHAHSGTDSAVIDTKRTLGVNKREWHKRPSGIITL